ncbi:MAG TPA: PAS domain-containing protein [Cyclobacteriaceae bacterium]|nr:PAS domain-containing protein [Cyclobacteriaceae bacterium]
MERLLAGLNLEGERNSVIISETDLHGTILSANDPFCTISGYSREELIGRSHNIIRHPSMPKELFRQLWMTIKKGDTFRAVIKNRTKSGDHYWVNATIMPVFHGGKIIRYVGGRYLITDDKLAEELFQKQMAAFENKG